MSFEKVVKLACKPKAAPPKAKVVFKALITLHQMIRSGSTDNILSHLSQQDILRLRNVSSQPWEGIPVSATFTDHTRYLDVRIRGYKELQHDPVRVQSDSNRMSKYEGVSAKARKLRQLTVDKGLLREVKQVQRMIDSLLDCKLYDDDLHDECTVVALRMLLKDLLVLFQAGNEGVINVLEHYFEMSKLDATDALSVYKSFCKQTDNVVEYLSMARKLVNLLNVPVPNLKHAPVSLAKALEEYLQDPNFEQNRIEYKANMGAVDGLSAAPSKSPAPSAPSAPAPAPAPSSSAPVPAANSMPSSTSSAPSGQRAIQDFFDSIQAEQQPNMFGQMGGQSAYAQSSVNSQFGQPQFNPFRQSMMQPQATGFMGMQPQMTGFPPQTMQFQPQPTFSPQQQGAMGFSPFQNGAPSPFLQPQHTMNFTQQQQQSQYQQQQQSFEPIQAQPTGSNPFRQSTFVSPSSTGQQSPFSIQSTPSSGMAFGSSNPQAGSQGSQQPLTSQPTGSKNPFAPPPGTAPPVPAMPSQVSGLKGPSLRELAAGGPPGMNSPFAVGSGTGQTASGLAGGGMSDLASAFITTKPGSPFGTTSAPGNNEWGSKPQSAPAFQGLETQSFPSGIQAQPTGFLQPQATGFTSSVKPFKPTSSFGSTLVDSLPPIGTQRTGFQISSQQTGTDGQANPFRKPTSGTPGVNGSAFGGAASGSNFQGGNGFNGQSQGGSLF